LQDKPDNKANTFRDFFAFEKFWQMSQVEKCMTDRDFKGMIQNVFIKI